MKKCPQCSKEASDTAKFCGGCRYKFPDATASAPSPSSATCPHCGAQLRSATAKFCGSCGKPTGIASPNATQNPSTVLASAEAASPKNMMVIGSFVHWNIMPGQLAVKIDEKDIASYGKVVKGVNIQEGVKALFFANGRLVGELEAGNYSFGEYMPEEERRQHQGNIFQRFWHKLSGWFKNKKHETAVRQCCLECVSAKYPPVTVVLIRSVQFPLAFEFKAAATANMRSDVGLHVLCKIVNVNEFYTGQLLDRKAVGFAGFADSIKMALSNKVNQILASVSPDKVDNNAELQSRIKDALQDVLAEVYPYVAVDHVLQLTATNEAVEQIRQLQEQLYVSEQELAQLVKRNEFLNRLQAAKNEQELAERAAGNELDVSKEKQDADLAAAKEKIYEQMSLTQDERVKFDLLLAAQREIREAKSENDVAAAVQDFKKSGLLRDQEIDNLRRSIAQDAKLRDMDDAQTLAAATIQNQMSLDRQKLEWEIQVGNRRMENVLQRQRMQDAYADERRAADAGFQDSRREAELDFEKKERENQLEALRQAQAIRQEREEAEHRREMEELEKVNAAKLEEKRIYAGMTFEQIMAANPDISPEAAKALAQKFNADSKEELLKARESDMAKATTQQMEMMRMMQQMAMAGMGVKQSAQEEALAAKQAELDRTRMDASANSDRILESVKSGAESVAQAMRPSAAPQAPQSAANAAPSASAKVPQKKCLNCGATVAEGDSFCDNCGGSL